MTNSELFAKLNQIIEKEMKERQASGKAKRKYNEKNNGIWLMAVYRNGNKSRIKAPHLDIKNFVDNMSFEQMRRVCVEAGGKFYMLEKQQKGIKPEEMFKKKKNSKKK